MKMSEFKVKRGGHEIVVAKGKIINNSRPFFAVAICIKPNMSTARKTDFVWTLCEIVLKLKENERKAFMCIGGDTNRTNIDELLKTNPGLQAIPSPPSKGDAHLDITLSNFMDRVVTTTAYLQTPTGIKSDHRIITYEASLSHTHDFD